MKFAHKLTNVKGGNKLVTVTVAHGKALAKVSEIPTETSKRSNIPFKELVKNLEWHHEKLLKEEADKLEAQA